MEYRRMSDRAARIMQNLHHEQRGTQRKSVCLSARVTCAEPQHEDKIGLIRDVSDSGIFFYANFMPEVGAEITLSFSIPPSDENSPEEAATGEVTCRGRVVRLVKFSPGAATGIALRLEERDMMYRRDPV
jgi:PilZ domain